MMTPLEKYQADLLREEFHADQAQENAVRKTQKLFDALLKVATRNLTLMKAQIGQHNVSIMVSWEGGEVLH